MTKHQPPLGVSGWIVVSIAAVFFPTVAVWTGSGIVVRCVQAIQLRDAVQVDATIHNVEEIARNEAPDAVYVTYSYVYEGERYEHRTQTLASFDRAREVHQAAKEALVSGNTLPCYVDPDTPSLSVFSLKFSPSLFVLSLLFPVCFGGVSVIIFVTLIRQYRQSKRKRTASG